MAEHLGLSLPATSRMADHLVRRGLLLRRPGVTDRRRVCLSPTRAGKAAYRTAYSATRAAMAKQFSVLSSDERALISRAMKVLGRVFGSQNPMTTSKKDAASIAGGALK